MISKEKIEDARENYISDTLCQDDSITSDYGYGFLTGVEFAENELRSQNEKLVKACNIAKAELGACYKRLGLTTSTVITALNEAIESCAEPAQTAQK